MDINKTNCDVVLFSFIDLPIKPHHLDIFESEIEADKSYFSGACKGKSGRELCFGLFRSNCKVYIVVVTNAQSAILLSIICEQVKPNSIVYMDTIIVMMSLM